MLRFGYVSTHVVLCQPDHLQTGRMPPLLESGSTSRRCRLLVYLRSGQAVGSRLNRGLAPNWQTQVPRRIAVATRPSHFFSRLSPVAQAVRRH
jgi:hypothetical protein